jgi:acetoin utilization deacetylase AcuC-like enzyme
MKIITDSRCAAYSYVGHPERPERVARTVEHLRSQSVLPVTWAEPLPVEEAVLLRAHTEAYLRRLDEHLDFDMDTPSYPDIAAHARRSVGGALHALKAARKGEPSFSLMRPPGHHATRKQAMGFCYLANIAIATLAARAEGVGRVAVYDFDVHHGNGTEEILLNQPGCAFFSIHQFPAYPGTGREHRGNSRNYPVAPGTPRTAYRTVAQQALDDLKAFKPDLVAVSAGFDAYARDPLCQQRLEAEDFHWFGTSLRGLGVPVFSVLEGGYSDDLPGLILAYLLGLEGRELKPEALKVALPSSASSAMEPDPHIEPFWGPAF